MLEELRRVVQEVSAVSDLSLALEIIVDRTQAIMASEVCSV